MKTTRNLIAVLVGLCVLFAMVSFFLPDRSGTALSYLTMSLAAAVGVLSLLTIIRLYFHGE